MSITDLLAQSGGLDAIARELGLDQAQASQGVQALLPALMGGFKKQTQGGAGLQGLAGLLGQFGGGGLLDDVLSAQPTPVARGDAVLGQLFGSKEVSREVASRASAQSGLDAGVLKKMLPMLAMLVTGLMSRQGETSTAAPGSGAGGLGGLGGLVGNLLGGQGGGAGVGGLAAMLDQDGDGNALDDVMKLVGRGLR